MALIKIIALKPGTFINGKNGKPVTVDAKKIDDIIEATLSQEESDFPITIGHPKGDSPAWGWIKKNNVKKDDDNLVLLAEESDLNETFLDWLKKKFYKKVSLGWRKDNSISHIAFLGGIAPAVKGLPVTEFSEKDLNDIEIIEFSEFEMSKWWHRDLKTIIRNIKNVFIKDKSLEEANEIIPEHLLEDLDNPPTIFKKEPDLAIESSFSEEDLNKNSNGDKMKLSEQQIQEYQDKANKYDEIITENTKLKTDLGNATTQLSEKDASIKRTEYVSFCESDEAKMKIKPADKEGIIQLMQAADSSGLIELSEGEGENKADHKINLLDEVKKLVKNQPDVVSLSEFANNESSGNRPVSDDVARGKAMADSVNN